MTIRPLLSMMLCLTLAFTSQSMAVARGASAATGHMVLCTGAGPVSIYTDAAGKPTSAPHICPDSALNVIVGGAAVDLIMPLRLVQFQRSLQILERAIPPAPHPAPPSRGPPVFV